MGKSEVNSRMTRVVADQRSKFENDELFRKLSRESEIRYTGYRDRAHEERIVRFQAECREGRCPVAFVASGTNLVLFLGPQSKEKKTEPPAKEFLDFDKEPGKAHLKSRFIMNGVCITMKGWLDTQRLDGAGYLEYDDDYSKIEDKILRDTMEQSRLRLQEFEERQKRIKQEPLEASEMLIHFLQQKARADNKETKSQLFKTGKTLRRSVDPF